ITSSEAPVGFVFAKTSLDSRDNWTATLSHEALEMLIDPWIDCTARGVVNGKPALVAYEVCDPVENDEYRINSIAVSNFVMPAWFIPEATLTSLVTFDFLANLRAPYTLSAGGYIAYLETLAGSWQQAFGDKAPLHQRTPETLSRRGRR